LTDTQVIPIWKASVGRYFMEGRRLEARLSVFDLLNRNNGVTQSNSINYIENSEIATLGRYGMLSLIYNLKKSGGRR